MTPHEHEFEIVEMSFVNPKYVISACLYCDAEEIQVS